MDALLEQARTIYEGEIDFEAQRLAETLSTALLMVSGIISFVVGFFTQNIYNTLYIGLGGTALTFLIVVPPWPFYDIKPLSWLPARNPNFKGAGAAGGGIDLSRLSVNVDGKKVS